MWKGVVNCVRYFTLFVIVRQDDTLWISENRGHHLIHRQNCFCYLWRGWSRSFLLFVLLFWLWSIMLNPGFIHGHKLVQKILRISFKQLWTVVSNRESIPFLSNWKQLWDPSHWNLRKRQFVYNNVVSCKY